MTRSQSRPPRRLIPALLALLSSTAAAPALAAEDDEEKTFYDVEIILFENLDVRDAENERWQPLVAEPRFKEVAAFERGRLRDAELRDLPEGFRELGMSASQLDGALEKLRESERYRVLRHLLWRQPALDRSEAVALRVTDGEAMRVTVPAPAYAAPELAPPRPPKEPDAADGEDTDGTDGATGEDGEPAADGATATLDDDSGDLAGETGEAGRLESGMRAPRERQATVYPLDGTITLVVSRYLHLHAQLYYTTAVDWGAETAGSGLGETTGRGPDEDADGAAEETDEPGKPSPTAGVSGVRPAIGPDGRALLSYPFDQSRRMRSGELHYLDNPVIGLLVLVTPREAGNDETSGGDAAG